MLVQNKLKRGGKHKKNRVKKKFQKVLILIVFILNSGTPKKNPKKVNFIILP